MPLFFPAHAHIPYLPPEINAFPKSRFLPEIKKLGIAARDFAP
jgi:hypothetical protein